MNKKEKMEIQKINIFSPNLKTLTLNMQMQFCDYNWVMKNLI